MEKNETLWEDVYKWNKENKNNLVYPDEEVIRIIKKFFVPSNAAKVLDAGCGSGRHTLALLREGFQVTALDSSQTALEIAGELTAPYRDAVRFQHGSLVSLPFPDHAFDAVLCWGVLHYLSDAEFATALGELHRVLAPGGYLGLTLRSVHDSECDPTQKEKMQESSAYESRNMAFKYFAEEDLAPCFTKFARHKYGHKSRTIFEDKERTIAHWYIAAQK